VLAWLPAKKQQLHGDAADFSSAEKQTSIEIILNLSLHAHKRAARVGFVLVCSNRRHSALDSKGAPGLLSNFQDQRRSWKFTLILKKQTKTAASAAVALCGAVLPWSCRKTLYWRTAGYRNV
jgi:hypothetical protein